jgi:hypothetical protein
MSGKRLALGALLTAVVVVVSGAVSNSVGQPAQQQAPGVTYGGSRALDTAWLRLDRSRRLIVAIELPWEIAQKRCNNDPNGYFSVFLSGLFYQEPIVVSSQGRFSKTVVDRYRDRGIRYVEHQVVTGTIGDEAASGTIRAHTTATRPNGQVARCRSLLQRWRLVN